MSLYKLKLYLYDMSYYKLFRRTASLHQIIVRATVLPLALALCILGAVLTTKIGTDIREEEGNVLASEARYFAELIDFTIGQQLINLQSRAALLPKLELQHRPERLSDWLDTIQKNIPEYTWVGLADRQGKIIGASDRLLIGESVREREWFLRGQESAVTVDVHEAQLLAKLLPNSPNGLWRFVDLATPVIDSRNQMIGVLAAHLSWDWLTAQHRRFAETLSRNRHAEIIAVGSDGAVRLVASELAQNNLNHLKSFQLARAGLSGWIEERWPDQQDYLVGYTSNPGYGDGHQFGWVTLIRLPVTHVHALIDPAIFGLWSLIIGMALTFGLVTWFMLRTQLRPAEEMTKQIEQIAQYGGRVRIRSDVPAELQRLGQVTNQMITAMEAGQAADRAKSRFLADMSHELRTPLHGLISHAELLKSRLKDQHNREDLTQLINCSQDLNVIVNDILDLSAIEENRLRIDAQPLQLTSLVSSVIPFFVTLAQRKNIEFKTIMDFSHDMVILADRHRLGQILRNLLSNAIKFTQHGSVTLHIRTCMEANKPMKLILEIQDTGIGLSRAQQEIIFGRFQQAEPETRSRYGGSGLGLSLTRSLVRAMGGDIDLASEPQHGTRIQVTLPMVVAPAGTLTEQFTEIVPTAGSSIQRLRTLVVDDLELNRNVLSRWLSLHQCDVDFAENATQALSLAETIPYDLIFMDIDLPDMNGRDAARSIRLHYGASRDAIIFAVSGHAYEHDIQASKEAGIDEHLIKPLDFAGLKLRLQKIALQKENAFNR